VQCALGGDLSSRSATWRANRGASSRCAVNWPGCTAPGAARYRLLYRIDEDHSLVLTERVDHRTHIYRRW